MSTMNRVLVPAFLVLLAVPAAAQTDVKGGGVTPAGTDTAKTEKAAETSRPITLQHYRPNDQRGINMFEAPKDEGVSYDGFKIDFGAAFTQQFQGLDHSNGAAAKPATDAQGRAYDANQLVEIGKGFNNATANLYIGAQLAAGIRVALTSYLSSRHHNETWVKDGYLLVDQSPIDHPALNELMKYVTLRMGHFEVNYGDAHFRRTDNGNAMHNPFVGNLILDSFTTEIGGEVYVRKDGMLAMVGVTGGQIRGDVKTPDARGPAVLGKLGFDRQLSSDLRVRLTGSTYINRTSPSNTLYAGDRAGSRYYWVMENTVATESGNFTSGLMNPRFANQVTSWMVNPFVKFRGLELFGTVERTEGRASSEPQDRQWRQYAGEAVYRFLPGEKVFVAGRYNTARGELPGLTEEVGLDRWQASAGWFVTPSIMLKGEYVTQKYNDFPTTDIRNNGKFNGFVVEGVVAF